ncbi:Short-chain dehydrogenase RED1 [Linum perenne]
MDSLGLEIVLITGCSEGGIGHALAKQFAATNKCLVVATSRSLTSMKDLENDDRFFLQELDVSSDESVAKVVANIVEKYGRVDVLVNNAGVQCVGPLAEVPLAAVQSTFNTNVFGKCNVESVCSMRMIQAVVPHMASKKKGKIVNLGSIVVLAALPWSGAYAATKAAIHALTDTLRLELKPLGIKVTNVAPGAILSKIMSSAESNYDQLGSEWKLYKPYEPAMRRFLNLGGASNTSPADAFAKTTVAAILRKNPPAWFSAGKYSTIFGFAYYLPLRVKDLLVQSFLKP